MKLPTNIDWSHVVLFTDLHLGLKHNSRQHNEWCAQFVDWMIDQAHDRKIRTCVFLGDWSHHRAHVNVVTLNYSLQCLRKLSQNFDHVIMLLGNHDLYYRDKLDMHSIPYVQEFSNCYLIHEITETDQIAFVPWLVGDQFKQISKIRKPYLMCHAEIARFRMNAHVEMPDNGTLTAEHFEHQKLVFSGHFHKRQRKDHILYMGNAFPHNFADAHDDQRGCAFWIPGQEPEFASWPGAPKYRTWQLSQVLKSPHTHVDNQTFARIHVDVDLQYEDTIFLKELFETQLQALDVSLIHNNNSADQQALNSSDINFESVDSIVLSHLRSIESNTMSSQTLIDIYQSV
jgi:DNA repair exonuclease SbcCD nuclease subunit